ncbi:TniQ family protein [Rhizobium leguminosarum]|uniref:TniQ family protein n=1 Tax=Rhizobium leguminosarum TaxID=384 RepID=UPI00042285E7|nr:TniQ family protein [Rhizobium leguminosarum]
MSQIKFPIGASEPLVHFASRYARSRGVRLHSFMSHMGLPLANSAEYERSSAILSRMTGNGALDLQAHAMIRRTSQSTLFGQTISVRHLTRDKPRFCPVCIATDIEQGSGRSSIRPVFRAAWMVKHICACPDHDVALVTMETSYERYRCPDFSNALNDHWHKLLQIVQIPDGRLASAFDRYFTARLSKRDFSNEVLDSLSYRDAIEFCMKVGSLRTGAATGNRGNKILPEEADGACCRGFDAINGGFKDFGAFLVQAAAQRTSMSTGFGSLLHHIAVNKDQPGFEAIADLAREVAFAKTTARRVLGITRSSSFTVRSAADIFNIAPPTARKMFDLNVDRSNPAIDATLAQDVVSKWNDRISRSKASNYLQINVEVLDEIEEVGLLKRHTLGSLERSFYYKSEIKAFLKQVAEHANQDPNDPEMVQLLAKRVRFSRVITEILAGTVKTAITSDVEDFNLTNLLVHRDDLRVYEYEKPQGTQTIGYVQMKLRLSANLLRNLRQNEVIESVVIHDDKGKERVLFVDASIERFKEKFVSVKYLTRHKADLPKTERRLLGVTPVFDFGGNDRVYRREDLVK